METSTDHYWQHIVVGFKYCEYYKHKYKYYDIEKIDRYF